MSDALVSPAVAAGAAALSVAALAVAASKVRKSAPRTDTVPLMGVMGAFIFAAQMINFTIPGTGSSGHIVGGILAAAMLGPWAALITVASVLVIQCLLFADGGLMAIGCNILNMAVCTCLIAYPLIYRPIAGHTPSPWRIMVASVLACIFGLELGASFVTAETELSGITALPWGRFFSVMTGIHLAIGAVEGVATGLLLSYVAKTRPALLLRGEQTAGETRRRSSLRPVLFLFGGLAIAFAITFTWIASSNPDGLEWSLERLTGSTEIANETAAATRHAFESVQGATAALPDYESTWSGIIGCTTVVILTWGVFAMLSAHRRRHATRTVDNR